MVTDPNERRRRLTFAQREAGAPVPDKMKRDEIPRVLRIKLYERVSGQIAFTSPYPELTEEGQVVGGQWARILYDAHIEFHEELPDEYSRSFHFHTSRLKDLFLDGRFDQVYGFLEYVLRHPSYTAGFAEQLATLLEFEGAPYRILNRDTIVPFTSDEEMETISAALANISSSHLEGVHAHYKTAAEALGKADFAGSMRESIHAVESLTKLLTGKATLQEGVKVLAKQGRLHTTVQSALEKIAAWTNAVAGIRHANDAASASPDVDEHDATYMLALCGATLSYLKRRGDKRDVEVS